ncbi:AI-2E family transporter, partial [bacterium]|nr:AI-2E family transporter [bacterium]
MTNRIHPLIACASIVIIIAGLRAAASIVSLLLLAALLAASIAPLIVWQLRKGWSKNRSILVTVSGFPIVSIVMISMLLFSIARLGHQLPAYKPKLTQTINSLTHSLAGAGINLKTMDAFNPEKVVGYATSFLGAFANFFSDAILVALLVLFIIIETADLRFKYDQGLLPETSLWNRFFRSGGDVRKYVSITAFTGFLGAVGNLILLLVIGVDAPVLWAFLSFLFNFIPNFGFILSLIPPALLTLLKFGFGRAIIVVVGFVI